MSCNGKDEAASMLAHCMATVVLLVVLLVLLSLTSGDIAFVFSIREKLIKNDPPIEPGQRARPLGQRPKRFHPNLMPP